MADEKKSCGDGFKNAYGNNEIRFVEEDNGGVDYASGKKKTIGSLKVDIDCSEALTGLKAVQREAKKATAALRELERQEARQKVKSVAGRCGVTKEELDDLMKMAKQVREETNHSAKEAGEAMRTMRSILGGGQS